MLCERVELGDWELLGVPVALVVPDDETEGLRVVRMMKKRDVTSQAEGAHVGL